MHIISGLKKRCLGPPIVRAAAIGEAPTVVPAKKPTGKEMREAEIREGIEQTRKNLELAESDSEGGTGSDNQGSEGGIPPEVAVEDAREVEREADRMRLEENYKEREREQAEEDLAEAFPRRRRYRG
jgi:hypothetical protein